MNNSRLTRWGTWIVVAVISAYVFQANVTPNIVQLPLQSRVSQVVQSIMPQGWGFFTKPADSSIVSIYRNAAPLRDIGLGANSEVSWAFGLDRTSRYQGLEIASLLDGIEKQAWTECDSIEDATTCISGLPIAIPVLNVLERKTICGPVAFVAQGVSQWEYRRFAGEILIPREAIALEVNCGN
ncbi:SdpA family antimicrobial peptide system protein [Mycetocola sp. JXN-3]|uniref:SdpA family antimicrobial peptide system protein n=1 Tax=Mycetocola sp. JXN-3 TaxID=2116510 RepID=UPI00165D2DB9|nr:SdpA family antimicrobial peptide system protein [Mycetocola sp. JXN-3]